MIGKSYFAGMFPLGRFKTPDIRNARSSGLALIAGDCGHFPAFR